MATRERVRVLPTDVVFLSADHAPPPWPRGVRLQRPRPSGCRFGATKRTTTCSWAACSARRACWAIEGAAAHRTAAGDCGRLAALAPEGDPLRRAGRRRAEGGAAGGGRVPLDAGAVGRAVRAHPDRGDGQRHPGARAPAAARCRRSSRPTSAPWATRWTSWSPLRPSSTRIDPAACRDRVERYFTHRTMAAEYLRMYPGCCRREPSGGTGHAARSDRPSHQRRDGPSDRAAAGAEGDACRCARPAPAAARRPPPARPRPGRAGPRR